MKTNCEALNEAKFHKTNEQTKPTTMNCNKGEGTEQGTSIVNVPLISSEEDSKRKQNAAVPAPRKRNMNTLESEESEESNNGPKKKKSKCAPLTQHVTESDHDASSSLDQSSNDDEESYECEADSSSDMCESGDSTSLYPGSASTCSLDKPRPEEILATIRQLGPMPLHQIKIPDEHPDRTTGPSKEGSSLIRISKPSVPYFDMEETLQLAEDCRPYYCNYRIFGSLARPGGASTTREEVERESDEGVSRVQWRVAHQDGDASAQKEAEARNVVSQSDENEAEVHHSSRPNEDQRMPWPLPHPKPVISLHGGVHLGSVILAPRLEDALAMRLAILRQHSADH